MAIVPAQACPVCFSDRLDSISVRMMKCESCGFIWNHEVSERDNLMLIVEHQAKLEKIRMEFPPEVLDIKKSKRARAVK